MRIRSLITNLNGEIIVRWKRISLTTNADKYYAIIRRKERKSYINIKLNASRLRGFKDSELKEKYRKESYLNLRLVTVELESGEIERLLTNIPPEYNVNRGHLSYLWSEMDNRNKLQYFKKTGLK